jgi:hypothetical protein
MFMQTPAAFFDPQLFDVRLLDPQVPAPAQSGALWFVIGLIFSALLVYASAKYGIANPEMMMVG